MCESDLDFCVECVTNEGWLSETRETFEAFLAHDSQGCFISTTNGKRVGLCVATAYDTAGFLGELIVVPEQRGRGLGRQLMAHAIAYLRGRGCASIYLDGDLPAIPLYKQLGFTTVCKSLRFLGTIAGDAGDTVRPLTEDDMAAVIRLDRAAFGADRSFFLKRRLEKFPALAHARPANQEITGYIMGQPGHGVITIGPWLGDDSAEDPLDLLSALARHTADRKLRLGVLETNPEAAVRLRAIGTLEETIPCQRMMLGPDCSLGRSNRLWAIGSAATG